MSTSVMTYEELADRAGITVKSAKNLVRRKPWRRMIGNDCKARIEVPDDEFEAPSRGRHDAGHEGVPVPGIEAPSQSPALVDAIVTLRELVDAERRRADAEAARVADLIEDRDRWHALATRPWWQRLTG